MPTFSLDSALDYIRSALQDFYDIRGTLQQDYQDARRFLQEANRQGQYINEASQLFQDTITLLTNHADLELKLKPLADAFGVYTGGLGIAPAVLLAVEIVGGAVAVIALASYIYGFFEHYMRMKTAKDLIQRGLLPAESIFETPTLFQQISKVFTSGTGLLIVAVGGYLIYQNYRR
jgi:hypothetical protein